MPPRTIIDCFFQKNPCYHVRIIDESVTLDKTFEAFRYKVDFLIVAQEGSLDDRDLQDLPVSTRLHQHLLISSSSFSEKSEIKELILHQYPDARGNSGHSITIAKNKQVLASYVLKEGLFKFKGFTNQFIEDARKLSFSQNDFKKKYKALRNSLILGDIKIEEYAVSLLRLKADNDQPIYYNHFKAHIVSTMIRQDDSEGTMTQAFVRNMFNSIEFSLSN